MANSVEGWGRTQQLHRPHRTHRTDIRGLLLGSSAVGLLPGLGLAALLAVLATESARLGWLQANGISALTVAIVFGMLVGNTFYPRLAGSCARGVTFSKQTLLRLGIVLYGLRLTFQDIGQVGFAGVLTDGIVLCSTFLLSWWLGTRVLGLDRRSAMLIGAGSSICGAAAVMAAEPVVRGRAEQVTVAVSTVVVFGTLAIFLYPALYHLNLRYQLIGLSPSAYGLYAGSTVHEVAQVVAAGRAVSEQAANTAVIAKMVRVMMLAPFLLVLSAYLSRVDQAEARVGTAGGAARASAGGPGGANTAAAGKAGGSSDSGDRPRRIAIPWFALGFVAVAGLNSLALLPKPLVANVTDFDTGVLAMAMAALGLTTHASAIRSAGLKPLALAAVLFAWLVGGGIAINATVAALFAS
jgi:uncharacterized integral membrane protein (TIGR00698 family)